MVARDGVEPPTPAFSVFLQQLNFAEWPQFCDHSVTSADVRLSVGQECPTAREEVLCPSRQIGPNYVHMGRMTYLGHRKGNAQLPRSEPPLINTSGGLDPLALS